MTRAARSWLGPALAVALTACTTPSPPPRSPSAPVAAPDSGPSLTPTSVPASADGGAPAAWERLPDAPFARLEMAVAVHEGRIWLAGGLAPTGEALSDVDVFDPATGTWSEGPALPTAVHHAALVSDGDRLLFIGGYLGSAFNRPTEIVLVLDDGDDAWREGPALPIARAAGAAAWDGVRVVYAGGVADGVTADVFVLEAGSWQLVGAMAGPREHLAATSDGAGRTWLLGGRVGGLDGNLSTVELVEGDEITQHVSLPTARGGVAAFHAPGLGACLTGGEAPDRAYTVVECIGEDGSVSVLPKLEEPHHGHGAGVVDGVAYVLLGGPEPLLTAASTVEALVLEEPGR